MDARFQLLCAVVMDAAGATKKDGGGRFLPSDFNFDPKFETPAIAGKKKRLRVRKKKASKVEVNQMEQMFREYVMINNARFGAPVPDHVAPEEKK